MLAKKTMGIEYSLALAMMLSAPALALEDNQILPGAKRIDHVSAGDLEGACNNSGGDFIETSEEYGCATDDSWVYCEKSSGDCVGGSGGSQEKTRLPGSNGQSGAATAGTRLRAVPQAAGEPTGPARAEPEHAGPRLNTGTFRMKRD